MRKMMLPLTSIHKQFINCGCTLIYAVLLAIFAHCLIFHYVHLAYVNFSTMEAIHETCLARSPTNVANLVVIRHTCSCRTVIRRSEIRKSGR